MKVLIYEPNLGGHYFMFLKYLALAIHKLGIRPMLVLSRDAPSSPRFQAHLAPIADIIDLDASIDPVRYAKAARRRCSYFGRFKDTLRRCDYLSLLKDSFERHRPGHVYVPSADDFLVWLGIFSAARFWKILPNVEMECVAVGARVFHQNPAADGGFGIGRQLRWRAIAVAHPALSVGTIDPVACEWIKSACPALAQRLAHFPETIGDMPSLDKPQARRVLGIPEDGRYVVLAGLIDPRKGADALLRAFAAAPLQPDDRLLLAGVVHADIRQLLETEFAVSMKSGRIIIIDEVLPDGLLNAAVAAADVVAVLYQNHFGGSNIALRAAFYGRPVLATNFAWAARVVPLFRLGWLVDSAEPEVVGPALAAALQSAEAFSPSPACRILASFVSVENFQACWTARLARRLGCPDLPRITWDEVLASAGQPTGIAPSPRSSTRAAL